VLWISLQSLKNKQPAPTPVADTEDTIMEMRMQAKMMERAAKRSDKDSKQQIQKARGALIKGNEEGAKLYLQNANMKNNEALNNMRTGHRLEAVTTQLRSNENNMALANQLNKLTPLMQQQANLHSVQNVNQNMMDFQSAMDKLTITGNMMNAQMDQGMMDPSSDTNVDKMLADLKAEVNADINKDFVNVNRNFQYQNINQNQNYDQSKTFRFFSKY